MFIESLMYSHIKYDLQIGVSWALTAIMVVLSTDSAFLVLVKGWGNPQALSNIGWCVIDIVIPLGDS